MKATSGYHKALRIGLLSQAIALVMGMALHSRAVLAGRTLFYGKIFTPAVDLLFVPFIMFHVRTIFSWGTAHFMEFPEKYSLFVIPLQLLFLLIVSGELRTERGSRRGEDNRRHR